MASPTERTARKTRSTGDIPREPEKAHLPTASEASAGPDSARQSSTFPSSPELSGSNQSPFASSSTPTYPSPPSPAASSAVNDRHNHRPPPPMVRTQAPSVQRERPNIASGGPRNTSIYMKLLLHLGLGRNASAARKALVSSIWTVGWYVGQIVIITIFLILSGIHYRSPMNSSLSEWKACDRPLGTWASIWVIRVILSLILSIWEYQRGRRLRSHRGDVESVELNGVSSAARSDSRRNRNELPAEQSNIHNGPPNAVETAEALTLPYSGLYARLTLISSLLTLSWFLTAHILEYSSINTCRYTSPHIWWLVFGILAIMYLMVLEVVVLGIVVLIIAPILFIFWNLFLLCLGRHPLQNPHMIKPEIGGLPKSVVDRIPLVMYIPPSPEEEKNEARGAPHIYPPKVSADSQVPQQKRFKLLHRFRRKGQSPQVDDGELNEKSDKATAQDDTDDNKPISWEDNWESSDYPFVALDGNRAVCAICLLDFEEPKRKRPLQENHEPNTESNTQTGADNVASGSNNLTTPTINAPSPSGSDESRREPLKLEDAGEGPQPLRLLACGHVFHKTCLDPWLIDVSGRCPICQRAVEVPKSTKKSRRLPRPQT